MKLIPKYQEGTTRDGIQDNTRVNYSYSSRFRPQLVKRKSDQEKWEEYRMLHDKNEQIGPVQNVPEDLRERYRRRAETQQWMDQRARNFESFGNLLNLTLPSTYVGQAIGRQLTGPEALAVDLLTGPVLGGIKAVGKKGIQTATKLATKGAEAYKRRFVYPREGLPQWFYTQKPLIAGGKIMNEPLPQGLLKNGWTLAEDGAFINPQGIRFIRNSEGKLQSEISLKESNKAVASRQKNVINPQIMKQKQQKELQKAIQGFEDAGILGFRTREWKNFRKGFKTTESDIQEYESHVPEYYKIFKDLVRKGLLSNKSGQWKGNINDEMIPVNARQYIISNHPNFINNGWKLDPVNRGTAMFPKTSIEIQNNGGLSAANWGTNSNEQLGVFSRQRDNGPILRGIVSTRNNPDRIVPVKHAHEARMERYNGITEFDGPVGLANNDNIKGNWRIYGPDMQIKAIDGNTGLFSKTIKNPLSGIIPPILLGAYYNYE